MARVNFGGRRSEALVFCVSFLYIFIGGYMNSVLNNPADKINKFIKESILRKYDNIVPVETLSWLWSTVIFCYVLGSFIGAIISQQLADRFGRKPTLMYFSSGIYLIAGILFYLIKPLDMFELLIVGRFLTGISNGVANPVLATFLVESIPRQLSGLAGSVIDFSACIGSFLGIVLSIGSLLGTEAHWQHLLGGPSLLFGILQLSSALLFKESPKYLLLHQHSPRDAATAVEFYYGDRVNTQDVWKILAGFVATEDERSGLAVKKAKQVPLKDILRMHSDTAMICLALGMVPLAVGYTIFLSYSTEVLQISGMDAGSAQTYTTLMGLFEIFGSIGSLLVNYRSPRRLVLLSTTLFGFLLLAIIFVLLLISQYTDTYILVHISGTIMLLIAANADLGPFPLYLLLSAELAPQAMRSLATCISTGMYYFTSIIGLLLFFPVFKLIGAYAILPFCLLTAVLLAYLWHSLPESSPGFTARDLAHLRRSVTMEQLHNFLADVEEEDFETRRKRLRSESCPMLAQDEDESDEDVGVVYGAIDVDDENLRKDSYLTDVSVLSTRSARRKFRL